MARRAEAFPSNPCHGTLLPNTAVNATPNIVCGDLFRTRENQSLFETVCLVSQCLCLGGSDHDETPKPVARFKDHRESTNLAPPQ